MAARIDTTSARQLAIVPPARETLPPIPVPTAIEAEEAVIGSLLLDGLSLARVEGKLEPADFYRDTHRWIYEAALSLQRRGTPIDFVTLCRELTVMGRLDDIGGAAYLTVLINVVPTSVHIEHYGKLVVAAARRRRLIEAGSAIASLGHAEAEDIDACMDKAEQIIFSVTQRIGRGDLRPLSVGLGEVLDRIADVVDNSTSALGLSTGLTDFDRLTGGLHDGEYIVVAAPPSVGKSAWLGQIAKHAAREGKTVAVFSLEMSISQWAQRFLAQETNIDQQRIRLVNLSDADMISLTQHSGPLAALPLFIDDTPDLGPLELRSKARRFASLHPLDLIIVDYAQLMSDPDSGAKGNRVNELERISRAFKSLARELNVPVLVASQVGRESQKGPDKRAQMDASLGSGAFERDADVWLTLYREGYWNTPNMDPDAPPPPDLALAEIIVRKNRNGRRGKVDVAWQERLTRFVDFHEMTIAGQRGE
jgi:replicative DNA helicase